MLWVDLFFKIFIFIFLILRNEAESRDDSYVNSQR